MWIWGDETPIGWRQSGGGKEEKPMADFSRVSTGRPTDCSSATAWKAPLRLPVMLAVAAFALAGCNASQGVNPTSQGAPVNTSGRFVSTDNPYNPIKYAQTSGFYADH